MRRSVVVMAGILMVGLAGLAQGALIGESGVDKMQNDSQWNDKSGTNYFLGKNWLQYVDPNDRVAYDETSYNDGLELIRTDTNGFSWSYKTAAGKTFDLVQVSVLGRGWGESVSLTYKIGEAAEVSLSPTATQALTNGTWGSGSWLHTYDFGSLGIKPTEVKFTMYYWESYMPLVSSVKFDVVPEPATLGMLVVGGLLNLRKKFI